MQHERHVERETQRGHTCEISSGTGVRSIFSSSALICAVASAPRSLSIEDARLRGANASLPVPLSCALDHTSTPAMRRSRASRRLHRVAQHRQANSSSLRTSIGGHVREMPRETKSQPGVPRLRHAPAAAARPPYEKCSSHRFRRRHPIACCWVGRPNDLLHAFPNCERGGHALIRNREDQIRSHDKGCAMSLL